MITTESYKGIPVSIVGEAHFGGIWPTIISKIRSADGATPSTGLGRAATGRQELEA
jgi:hypothetical protein